MMRNRTEAAEHKYLFWDSKRTASHSQQQQLPPPQLIISPIDWMDTRCAIYYAIHFPSYANTICGCILKSGAGINWSIDRSHGHRSDYVLFSGTRRRRGYPYTSLSAHCNYYYYCIAFGRCFGGAAAARINSIAVVENNKNPSHRSQMSIRALFRSHIDHNVIHTVAEALGTCIHNTRMGWDRLNGPLCYARSTISASYRAN